MRSLIICLALIAFVGTIQAQSGADELAQLKDSLRAKVSEEMKGWTYHSVEPIQGSQGVIIQQWRLNDIIVNVAVVRYDKDDKAEHAFQQVKSHLRIQEDASGKEGRKKIRLIKEDSMPLGDEGFASDVRGSEAVTFRKGKFIISVSVPEPQNNKDLFFSRKFAHDVAKILDSK